MSIRTLVRVNNNVADNKCSIGHETKFFPYQSGSNYICIINTPWKNSWVRLVGRIPSYLWKSFSSAEYSKSQ